MLKTIPNLESPNRKHRSERIRESAAYKCSTEKKKKNKNIVSAAQESRKGTDTSYIAGKGGGGRRVAPSSGGEKFRRSGFPSREEGTARLRKP